MATLTNNINPQNIVDRFADYVTATAGAGISWGTNALPFAEFDAGYLGGTTTGRPIGISGATISPVGGTITASTIYSALVNETAAYTSIRNLRAVLFITGNGGNSGSRPTAGSVYDQTAVAHLRYTLYGQSIGSPANGGVSSGSTITSSGLESFFDNLRTSYSNARSSTVTIQIETCHASCHSSCHGSRGRR
jgi:hypothetical protein